MIDTHHGLASRLNEVFRKHKLSGTDFDLLIRLAHSPHQSLRLTDLSSQTWMSTSGITRVVDRLESAGLAERCACPGDRRSFFVVLTQKGERRLRELVPALTAEIDRSFTGALTPEQLDNLLDALRTVRATVQPGAAGGVDEPHGCAP
ncbi:MAG: MarR family winged helix-turn-helix transcriptional regulator [Micromonosporaceae bacterium]